MKQEPLLASYVGYTSCPVVTGYDSLVLAEFDDSGGPAETFPFNQAQERFSMFMRKKFGMPHLTGIGYCEDVLSSSFLFNN